MAFLDAPELPTRKTQKVQTIGMLTIVGTLLSYSHPCLRICALRFFGLTMAAWRSSGQVARGEGESDIFLIRRYEYTRARGIWYEDGRFACHSRTSVTCEWGKLAVPTSPPEARSKKSSTPGARTHAKPTKGQKRTTWGTHTVARRPPTRAAKGFPRRKS